MPSAYTEPLYNVDQPMPSFAEFALRCARGMGALVSMRDDPMDAPIPAAFQVAPYYVEALAKAQAEYDRIQALSDTELEIELATKLAAGIAEVRRYREDNDRRRARYEAMRAQAKAWNPPTPNHAGLKELMLEQIDQSMAWDIGPTPTPARVTVAAARHRAQEDLSYFATALLAEEKRVAERNEWLAELRRSLIVEVDYVGVGRSDYAANTMALGAGGWRVDGPSEAQHSRPYAVFRGTLEAAHASFQAILGRPLGEGEYLCAYDADDNPLEDIGLDPADPDPIGREVGP